MKERKWRLNGEPVIFDRLGRLVNGQQRLTACLMSDTPFRTLVVRGVEPEAFDTLDNGKKRTGADVLGIDGHVNTSSLSSAAILLIRYEQGTLTGEGGRYAAELYQVRDTVAAHPGLHESVQVAERLRRLCAKSAVAFCHYAFGRIDPEATGAFFEKLDSGADLAPGDPILVLRNRLAENRASAAKLRTTHVIALFFKAFNFAREGRKLGKGGLRWKAGIEDFPTLNP